MNWTFGFITGGLQEQRLSTIISSIKKQCIKEYEIIVVGSCNIKDDKVKVIPFDESIKKAWITRKKNIIAQEAKYENVLFHHDYIKLCDEWYDNFVKFGDDWDVCVNKIIRMDGVRHLDWFVWNPKMRLIPYEETKYVNTGDMFCPGASFCVKRGFILKNPLDENRCWGDGEDHDWSNKIYKFWNYKCNPNSVVQYIKKNRFFEENGKLPTDSDGTIKWR
jgi:hypothetical protein